MSETVDTAEVGAEALGERVLAATIGLFDLAGIYLGQRLGLYAALADAATATSGELARPYRHR